jgi:hypothetical protein
MSKPTAVPEEGDIGAMDEPPPYSATQVIYGELIMLLYME